MCFPDFYTLYILFTVTRNVHKSKQYTREVWSLLDSPEYNTNDARLATFVNRGPPSIIVSPLDLSRSGFYYVGEYMSIL
jgi:hypothetical protein